MKDQRDPAAGVLSETRKILKELTDGDTELPFEETDAFLNDDGLLCCPKCRNPIQCRVHIWGRDRIVSCLCPCRQEEMLQEQKRQQEKERMLAVSRLKAAGIQDKHLREWCFSRAQESSEVRRARQYVNCWEKVRKDNIGMIYWGDVGTGKSFLAACIANALLEQEVPVLMTSFSQMLDQMGGLYGPERASYIASLAGFELLIIDDLGVERETKYVLEQIYLIIDERYKTGKPLIVTTNLSLGELHNPADEDHARIYSRLLQMCVPVHVTGEDRRKELGHKKLGLARELLC